MASKISSANVRRGRRSVPEIRDVGASKKINALLFSDPGGGKTTFIGSGGHEFKVLIIRPPTDHVDCILGSGCKEMVVRDWEEMNEAQEYVRHEGHNWDWVWLDSISAWQEWGLQDVLQGVVDRKGAARAQYGPDKGEYRVNMWRLEQFVRHTVGAESFNFGITAWPFWYTDPDADSPTSQLMPWIQGKAMPQKICGYMNIVGFMEVRQRGTGDKAKEYRVMHTRKTPTFYAKDQFNAWTDTDGDIINPTLPKFMEAITKVRPRRRATRRPSRRTIK